MLKIIMLKYLQVLFYILLVGHAILKVKAMNFLATVVVNDERNIIMSFSKFKQFLHFIWRG